MRRTARILALAALAAALSPAAARAEDDDELVALNKKLQAAIAALPAGLGLTPTSDELAIRRIQATLAEVKPRLLEYEEDERLPVVLGNVTTLESELVSIQAGHGAVVAMEEIRAAHDKSQVMGEDKLEAFAAAVASFQKVANQRLKGVAGNLARLVLVLRKQNQDIADHNAAVARDQARAAAAARRAALAEQARRLLDRLYGLVKSGDGLPEADLAELAKIAEGAEAAVPGSAVLYRHEHGRLSRIALWQKAEPEAQQAVADSLGATLVAKGAAPAKAFSVTFPATEDWCYLVVGRFAKTSGTEKIDFFTWTAKAGRGAIQAFGLAEAERGAGFERGFCATRAGQVTASAKLSWMGGASPMRYAVLGWERAKLPADLALRLAIDPFDRCDPEHWRSLWTRPIPGTLVWRGAEPFLLLDEEGRGLDLNGAPVTLKVEQLSSKAHRAPRLATAFRFAGCAGNREPAWTADTKALKACEDPIVKKLARQKGELAGKKAAPEAYAKLEADSEAERATRCARQVEKISRSFAEAFDQLGAELVARPHSDSIDRAEALQARLGLEAQLLP